MVSSIRQSVVSICDLVDNLAIQYESPLMIPHIPICSTKISCGG